MNKVKNIDVQAAEKHGKIYDPDGKLVHITKICLYNFDPLIKL